MITSQPYPMMEYRFVRAQLLIFPKTVSGDRVVDFGMREQCKQNRALQAAPQGTSAR